MYGYEKYEEHKLCVLENKVFGTTKDETSNLAYSYITRNCVIYTRHVWSFRIVKSQSRATMYRIKRIETE